VKIECFRCGFCGSPASKNGDPLTIDFIKSTNVDWNNASPINGNCCIGNQEVKVNSNQQIVSKDMAKDAGMPELEGFIY
jgi:hypothetical protein